MASTKFTINKGMVNEIIITIKENDNITPIAISVTDTFTIELTRLGTNVDVPGLEHAVSVVSAENGRIKITIPKAVADNSDDKIKYKVCGVEEYIYPENTYDLVVSNLVLHYIENLANIYQKVYCTLKVGGYFLFNIEHPTFTAGVNEDWIYDENGKPKYWPIDNYYYTGERETNFLGQRVIKQHHTLTQILNPLIKCGFQIEAIEEAMPPADMIGMPGMCNEIRRPMMLLVKVKKV